MHTSQTVYPASNLSSEAKLGLLKTMLLSRHGDLKEQSLLRQGKGWFQIAGMGHEALAAIAVQLANDDYAFPYYRDRGFILGKGHDNYELALSFFAKKDSSSGGRQLPGHFSNHALNIWSHMSPVAAHLLPATGTAWGIQLDNKNNVVYASVGEAASRQGDFYEAMCFAMEKKLPVIFVVHDGHVSISTRTEAMAPLHIGALPRESWECIDGADVYAVYNAGYKAIQKARAGEGPSFLWCKVDRLSSHSSADDHRNYRSSEELSAVSKNDPIERFKSKLIDEGILTNSAFEALESSAKESINNDFLKAEKAQDPVAGDEMLHITAGVGIPQKPVLVPGQSYRMADALNQAFRNALQTQNNTYFFGEDIEDPLGGVFRLTKGLSTEFPNRVFNSPLAESTIIGIAAGMASYGKFPIFEIQFIDFIMPAWNQLVNSLANLRWRSYGNWSCPCIIYAPYGGYLPAGGIWHSQAQESAFAHFPGIHIVVPSTPEDAAGLVATAMTCSDPVLMLIPKHLMWASKNIPQNLEPVPIGKACIRKKGTGLTIVAWGNCTDIVEKALQEYEQPEIVEFIDLRTIQPWDRETIIQSIEKTGRLLVVQEDSENCSVGQMIITTLASDTKLWDKWMAPPRLVSKPTVHIGFNPIYEYSALPDKKEVLEAIHALMHLQSSQKTIPMAQETVVEKPIQHNARMPIKVPNLGEGLREAKVLVFFKNVGDSVKTGEAICEIETDKAVFAIESFMDGTLVQWDTTLDAIVQVGQPIALIESAQALESTDLLPETHTLDISQNTHTKALSQDVLNQLHSVIPASLTTNVSMEAIKAFRVGDNRKVTASIITAWCVVQALKTNTHFRRLIQPDQSISGLLSHFDFGVAVALEDDVLETGVIPQADALSWDAFNQAYRKAIKEVKDHIKHSKARTPIILSSMGSYQIRQGIPIVVPPSLAVLFLGDQFYEYIKTNETPQLQEVASLCITFDHRWVNGAGAAHFLNQVKQNIETFKL